MRDRLSLAFVTLFSLASAQETYWVGGTAGLHRIDAAGSPRQTVLPTSSRDVAVAPDGKVWLVAAGVTVLNSDGTPFRVIAPSAGITPYSLAIDAQGHAWLTGSGGGVEEFDAAGNSLGTLTLLAAAPRGIAVDAQGNKWIAHRAGPPGSISRIDAVTRAVTNHPLPATSLILPLAVYCDSRGTFAASHIWVVGDNRGAGELVEFDATGTALATHVISAGARLTAMTGDVDASGVIQHMWVGDWSLGNLHKVDVVTGTVTTFPQGAGVYGATFDGFGNVWATIRTGGLLRRIDPSSGSLEVESAVGVTTELGTRWQFATVVDQLGDLDGDGVPNLAEAMAGSSPFDPCSTPNASLSIQGPTRIGSSTALVVHASTGVLTGLAFAGGSVQPGLAFPGIGCRFQLDLATMLGATVTVSGPASLSLTIPNQAGLIGGVFAVQGINAAALAFTNVTAMRFF